MSVQVNFNARQFEPSVGGGNSILEPGNYLVAITNSEKKPVAGAGNEHKFFLALELTVQQGDSRGSKHIHRLNLWSDKPEAVQIAAKEFSAICHVAGLLDVTQTAQLYGRPFGVRLDKVPNSYTAADGTKREGFQNNVREYFDAHGRTLKEVVAGLGGQPQPTTAQPQPPGPVTTQQTQQSFGGGAPAPAGFTPTPAAAPAAGAGFGPGAVPVPGGFGPSPAAAGAPAGNEPSWR